LYPIIHKANKAQRMPVSTDGMQVIDWIQIMEICRARVAQGSRRNRVEMPHPVTVMPQMSAGGNTDDRYASFECFAANGERRSESAAERVNRFFRAPKPLLLRVK
jgi:hypothetical protein